MIRQNKACNSLMTTYRAPRKPTMGCALLIKTSPLSGAFQQIIGNRLLDRKAASCRRHASESSGCERDGWVGGYRCGTGGYWLWALGPDDCPCGLKPVFGGNPVV